MSCTEMNAAVLLAVGDYDAFGSDEIDSMTAGE